MNDAALIVVASCLALALPAGSAQASALRIDVVSTRADLVSGGDALTTVRLPAGTDTSAVSVTLNGKDVTSEFAIRPNGSFEGLVTGLAQGRNTLTATAGGQRAKMTVVNHPQSGPVFSGPQVQPWTCNAGALDPGCDRKPTFAYKYMPAGQSALSECTPSGGCDAKLQDYDPQNPPSASQVAMTTTDQGKTVPYIVRIETGSIDRGQYQIAVLYDPAKPWAPWASQSAWNGKLEIPGGSGAGTGHVEGTSPSVEDTHALGLGWAVASDLLLNNGPNSNIVTQAEAATMLKEYFVEHYGPIRYAVAYGCSGGSIFQQQTNNAYPGLYQGEIVACSFPDWWSTAIEVEDCQLLENYWQSSRGLAGLWTEDQMAAVTGDPTIAGCESWTTLLGYPPLMDPSGDGSTLGPTCGVLSSEKYNATSNPGGVRCDLQDFMVNVFGVRPPSVWTPPEKRIGRGFANYPYSNVGVQYGLKALMTGRISPQQFADLNAGAGGFTVDNQPQAARSKADAAALPRLYRSGAINEMNNMAAVPTFDLRGHNTGWVHEDVHGYAARARLKRATGQDTSRVLWMSPDEAGDRHYTNAAFDLLDEWLKRVEADHSSTSLRAKVAAHKPPAAVDECWDGAGQPITNQQVCQTLFPPNETPRIVAGQPNTDDVMQCTLKPLERDDYYPVQFTDAQWAELKTAFPTGVCDYSKAGVGQQGAVRWQTYQSPSGKVIYGGTPLGPAPANSGLDWTSRSFDSWLSQQ